MIEKDKHERKEEIIETCDHEIDVKILNDNYVSCCTKCGLIFDIRSVEQQHLYENSTKIGYYKQYRRKTKE